MKGDRKIKAAVPITKGVQKEITKELSRKSQEEIHEQLAPMEGLVMAAMKKGLSGRDALGWAKLYLSYYFGTPRQQEGAGGNETVAKIVINKLSVTNDHTAPPIQDSSSGPQMRPADGASMSRPADGASMSRPAVMDANDFRNADFEDVPIIEIEPIEYDKRSDVPDYDKDSVVPDMTGIDYNGKERKLRPKPIKTPSLATSDSTMTRRKRAAREEKAKKLMEQAKNTGKKRYKAP